MTLATVQKAEAAHLIPTYERYPVLLTHGRGVYLWDANGKRYLDLLSGIGVNGLGHTHPAVKKAIVKQAGKMLHTSNLFFHEYQAELAAKLTKISGLDRAFFTNSGTEAIEGALKMARAYAQVHNKNGSGPKWRIIALDNSFHGRTYGALSVTGQKKYRAPFEPVVPGVKFVKLNDVADLEKKFDHTVCAVLVEPIQGEGGIRPLTQEFLQRARELTKKSGALLIADEIQSGLGRTGKWFAYQHMGIQPDVVALAKPIAGGLPLGAILASSEAATGFSSRNARDNFRRRSIDVSGCSCGAEDDRKRRVDEECRRSRRLFSEPAGRTRSTTYICQRNSKQRPDDRRGTGFPREG